MPKREKRSALCPQCGYAMTIARGDIVIASFSQDHSAEVIVYLCERCEIEWCRAPRPKKGYVNAEANAETLRCDEAINREVGERLEELEELEEGESECVGSS